uniref:Receptor-like cytosolic serine/threonine-protein kinase RBK2 n=1 Tax=Rhizophora mucronata TaxID=61149 RepID=A0A2P2KVG3_RHIMU
MLTTKIVTHCLSHGPLQMNFPFLRIGPVLKMLLKATTRRHLLFVILCRHNSNGKIEKERERLENFDTFWPTAHPVYSHKTQTEGTWFRPHPVLTNEGNAYEQIEQQGRVETLTTRCLFGNDEQSSCLLQHQNNRVRKAIIPERQSYKQQKVCFSSTNREQTITASNLQNFLHALEVIA